MTNRPTPTTSRPTSAPVADEFQLLTYEVENNVAIVSIDRPDALNALNSDLLFELSVAFELAEADFEVRALIVTGKGRAFVAGADIGNMQNLNDPFSGREASLLGQGRDERAGGTALSDDCGD